MSVAVGIDPSLACSGVAVIDVVTGETVVWRAKTTPSGGSLRARRDRLRHAIDGTLHRIPPRVGVTVIEIPNAREQYGALAERHALTWWLIDQLLARGPVVDVIPSQRAKLATGNGRAGKDAVKAAVKAAHPMVHVADDNVADALALADAGAHWLGATRPYTPAQQDAYARLPWPT